MKKYFVLFLLASGLSGSAAWAGIDESRLVAVQNNGRVKTFDAFARETLSLVHGRARWNKRAAIEWLYDAAADPKAVSGWKWVRVDYRPLAETLGLPAGRDHYAFDEILPALDKIESLGRSASKKRDADQAPSLLERKAEALYQALIAVKDVMDGEAFHVLPPAQGASDPAWHSPFEDNAPPQAQEFRALAVSHQKGDLSAFREQVAAWNRAVRERTGRRYDRMLSLEAFYLGARPFGLAALLYLLGFLVLLARRAPSASRAGAFLVLGGFACHTLGLALRVSILGRPPVSNMYESIVWMSWVLVLASLILSATRRDLAAAAVGAIAGAVITLYGDLLPIDAGLDVLVPVLRSNYWLTIHVLTIVSSYGVFGLAMGLGHRHLWLHAQKKMTRAEEERSAWLIYRTIQVGLLMLGIGTVLGGVWANESWGRFWGWDPKETWALITFLGYLVLVHLHFARIVKPFALAVSAIAGFFLVLFTWYGVNFVLGRGLHSYGQGSGGLNWILAYLAAETAFLVWVFYGKLVKRI